MPKKFLTFAGLGALIALIMAVIVWGGLFSGVQKSLQNRFYDFDSPSPDIVVVAIDEKSLQKLGPLGDWPRSYYAEAIDQLNQAGASVIGVDMTFPDSRKGDYRLKETLNANKNVALATRYYFESGQRIPEWPNADLLGANPEMGWINIQLDEDGFVRQIPLWMTVGDKTLEAFAARVARLFLEVGPADFRAQDGHYDFGGGISVPVLSATDVKSGETHSFIYINYSARPGSYTHVSLADVLEGNLTDSQGNPVDFGNKIVLIGPTAIDLQDYYLSPVSEGVRMAGVEVHANAIQTIITGQFLRDQSPMSLFLTLAALLLVGLIVFSTLRPRLAIPVLLVGLFGVLVAGIVAYEFRIFLNVVYPSLTLIFTFVGSFVLRFVLEQSKRRFIEGAFGHYVSRSVVEQILRHPDMLELGGAKRTVTAFFSDIAGFTSISETMAPEQLVAFLNRYLGDMTEIILSNGGTLDKYEGDAIMAFWGAPMPLEAHAINACRAALESQKRLSAMRKEFEKEGLPPLRVRIGLNSGEVIAGNMGSQNRFDYTIMGDNVNLASRLEGINKQYGTDIMLSEKTYEKVKDNFLCRELDIIRPKGKANPVRVYELLGEKGTVEEEKIQAIEQYAIALEEYRQKRFSEALRAFSDIKNDPPSARFADRCAELLKNPPPMEWDGVYTFTIK